MTGMRLAILAAALVAGLTACGGDSPTAATEPESPPASDPGLQHIHGLGVSGDTLYIATHTGLWTAPAGQKKARRFGSSRQDIMGFSILGDGRFLGSGHPGAEQSDLPANLGLLESEDGGRSWKNVSLLGEADFHVLQTAGRQVYGVDSSTGALMTSTDAGRTWQRRTPPAGVFSLAIDPRTPEHILTSTERGLFSSTNAGRSWRAVRTDLAGLLAWPAVGRVYFVDGNGAISVSGDGGRQWTSTGETGGQPAAFIAHDDELYVALADGTVRRSVDGGRTWTLRAAP
jgi:photosystem II stability/assembly factor-like uncharacterized protein